ncbi:MAG TPA: glycosyltransferase family 2 protein [Stellaceae bacterium]|nr:glycosyltransferase family 2 protein [Stellaceae bacterium]
MIPPRFKTLLRTVLHALPHPMQRIVVRSYQRVAPVAYQALADARRSRSYRRWIELYDTLSDEDHGAIIADIRTWTKPPLISVVMPVFNTPERYLRAALQSITDQLYPNWELCIADDASTIRRTATVLTQYAAKDSRIRIVSRKANGGISAATNSAIEIATGEFIAFLDHDDLLPRRALYMVAREIVGDADLDIIYTDEDKISRWGRRIDPHFKSDWNPDLFLAQNMISHLGVYRTALVRKVGGLRSAFDGSQDYDLALRIVEQAQPQHIRHIPHILYHWRAAAGSAARSAGEKPHAAEAARQAVADHLQRQQIGAEVRLLPDSRFLQVSYSLPSEPLVSIIVPTKNRCDLLSRCVSGILERTRYRNLELLIVDNRSEEEATRVYLDEIATDSRVRVLRYDQPFNFSLLNNWAADKAVGGVLLFLNNDTEVISSDWLRHLVANACRREVGAVGAKLLYPNGRVQHAGVILGIGGVAGHVHLGRHRSDPGYFSRAVLQQNLSAVTAACIAMRRAVFDEVGGFNGDLRVAFNDVDLCLRIRQRGYLIVWTPLAELFHHESASRGPDLLSARHQEFVGEIAYMQSKWGRSLARDPYFNPNLSLCDLSISLAFPPATDKPWHSCQRLQVHGAGHGKALHEEAGLAG